MAGSNVTRRRGSPVVVVPVLLLLVCAGIAAVVGISLQPSSSTTSASGPTLGTSIDPTATPDPVPTGPCPKTAAIASPPPVSNKEARATWVSDTLNVLADRVQCTRLVNGTTVAGSGWGQRPEYVNYTGIDLDTADGVLRVYWKGAVPQVVRDRVGTVPAGIQVKFVTTSRYSSNQIDAGVGGLATGNSYAAIPPIAARPAGAPELVITKIEAREDGAGIGVTYAYADGTVPTAEDVSPAAVAKALETLTGGVTVFATPAAAAQ